MTQMNNLQKKRWAAARVLFIKMVAAATRLGKDALFLFDGEQITPDQIRIQEHCIYVAAEHCVYEIFDTDPDLDAGLYTTIPKFEEQVRSQFILAKKVVY